MTFTPGTRVGRVSRETKKTRLLVERAKGDTEIDAHHAVEDTSIALGPALREAIVEAQFKAVARNFAPTLAPLPFPARRAEAP